MHHHAYVCIVFIVSSSSSVDYETDAVAAPFDYGVDDPSFFPEQLGKPPLITRYRLFFPLLLALE